MSHSLCPAQQEAFEQLRELLPLGNVLALGGPVGSGRTTLLRLLHQEVGGAFLNMKDYLGLLRQRSPVALEETFEELVLDAMNRHSHVIIDDLRILSNVVGSCNHFYQRKELIEAPLTNLTTLATESEKKLIFGVVNSPSETIAKRCHYARIRDFNAGDYASLCRNYLGDDEAGRLDYAKLFRFSRELNAHQLKAACQWLSAGDGSVTTERLIDYLRNNRLFSNVDLGEVQPVNLHDLKGIDDVIRSLEANIIVPLENDALAAELNLKPKRGVLLAGPPGSGKTTIGRALAHRLKSKFFLLDGTFIAGTRDFYDQVHRLFEGAKQNAPAILFIDDSDVLFEDREESPGIYRYLLTLLDGLESETAGRVCVMMTVMDVGGLPPALVRSGRVELWLDLRLPDEAARAAILSQHIARLPACLREVEAAQLAAKTDGFSGADLKRLVEDGKALFAYDRARGEEPRTSTDYFLAAIETVRANKERYAQAEARAKERVNVAH